MALPEPEVEKVNLHASDADSKAPPGFPKPLKMKCKKKPAFKHFSQFKPPFEHLLPRELALCPPLKVILTQTYTFTFH